MLALASCSGPEVRDGDALSRTGSSPIAYGVADSVHTAVVSILAPIDSNSAQECTGSIVQIAGGEGYVLTAAHCCNAHLPTLVVASNDYVVGEMYLGGGTPKPPSYAVVAGSVYYDALYQGGDHDFCMVRFSGASAGTPTLALPTSSNDGLQLGSRVEHIGFGITESSTTNSGRRTGTDTVDQALTPLVIQFSQGGSSHIPGTCSGDSGGPSLLPAGVSQSAQVVVAVQSYGNAACSQDTFSVGSRVSSEVGTGRFISKLPRRVADRHPRRRRLGPGGSGVEFGRSCPGPCRRRDPSASQAPFP